MIKLLPRRFCAGFSLAVLFVALTALSPARAQLDPRDSDLVQGPADAPVQIVEYASMSCPHCAAFHATSYPVIEDYIETGQVKYIFRDFPLNQPAVEAAKLIRCAPGERRFGFLAMLFKTQRSWMLRNQEERLEKLKQLARLGGIGPEEFDQCMADTDIARIIYDNERHARTEMQVRATPTVYINGDQQSDLSPDAIREEIEDELGN